MTRLGNIIKQIESLNTLVIRQIFQPDRSDLNENDNDELTHRILTHKSSSLRSVELQYPYHYLNISNNTSIGSNLTSFNLRITDSPSTVSIHSVLRVFRLCHKIRYRVIVLYNDKRFENNNINVPNDLPSANENDLPILSQLTSSELMLGTVCDVWSISYILRCMSNLKHVYFQLLVQTSWPFTNEYLDGYVWQEMLELYLPCLFKFEFHMSLTKRLPKLDLDFVVNSFNYFVNKYSNLEMIIDRWIYGRPFQGN
ncbi:unnamed protein product [Rotaria sp. Silwood2]|nr:unnamed protein product [Rotaria sp. Silwood2]CAF4607778.1 unnamed protein product [Rotaria sp. Silwood2]